VNIYSVTGAWTLDSIKEMQLSLKLSETFELRLIILFSIKKSWYFAQEKLKLKLAEIKGLCIIISFSIENYDILFNRNHESHKVNPSD
jgi:hypothetical protein